MLSSDLPPVKHDIVEQHIFHDVVFIKSYKLHDCCETRKNGEPLTLFDENGALLEYGHNFSGLNVGIFFVISL